MKWRHTRAQNLTTTGVQDATRSHEAWNVVGLDFSLFVMYLKRLMRWLVTAWRHNIPSKWFRHEWPRIARFNLNGSKGFMCSSAWRLYEKFLVFGWLPLLWIKNFRLIFRKTRTVSSHFYKSIYVRTTITQVLHIVFLILKISRTLEVIRKRS